MYIKDPNSNKMYAIESAQGQDILRQMKATPQVDIKSDIISTSMQMFNTEPYMLVYLADHRTFTHTHV